MELPDPAVNLYGLEVMRFPLRSGQVNQDSCQCGGLSSGALNLAIWPHLVVLTREVKSE